MSAFYHSLTKNIIGCFGQLFSDIHIIRRYRDTKDGPALQDIKVPISYAPKMKWWQALTGDPARQKQTNITLPRMSFEILGYTYDASRKKTRSGDISCTLEDGTTIAVGTPAPWNIDMALYVVANNQEDILQIIEQILPLFNPDHTIRIRAIPELNVISNVPISLTSVSIQDDYDGEYTSHRLIVYTLSFTIKTEYFGEVKNKEAIFDVTLDIDTGTGLGQYHVTSNLDNGEVVVDEWNWNIVLDEDVHPSSLVERSSRYKSPGVYFTERCVIDQGSSEE